MKKLTTENWLDVDPIIASGIFVQLSLADGTVQQVSAQDWTKRLLAVQVSPEVPTAVRDQIEIARGAMIYGSLFYPLFTLGLEQLFRITESAARAKAACLGMPTNRKYHEILADLQAQGTLTASDHQEWSGLRQFRNVTTHAGEAMILPPAAALNLFATIVVSINRLFVQP